MTAEVNPQNVAKMREVLDRVHHYLGRLIRDDLVEDAPETSDMADEVWDALNEPPRNCDRPEFSTPEQALAALKERFPIEAYFPGFKMAVEWMLATQDYRIAEPVSRRFGQQPKEGGAK